MTRDEAEMTAQMFTGMGFSKVEIKEFCWNSGNWTVELWSVNAEAGNRNLHTLRAPVTTEKEAKLIAKVAKGNATARDREALGRIASEKANS